MKDRIAQLLRLARWGALALVFTTTATATAQVAQPAPQEHPVAASPPQEPLPPPSQWTVEYATGRWVYTTEHGWIWVPNDTSPVLVASVPYVHLYTPSFGWTWYSSPWGIGPYRYGPWVHRPWRPYGWGRPWVAGPRVTARLGPGAFHYGYRYGYGHGSYHGQYGVRGPVHHGPAFHGSSAATHGPGPAFHGHHR